MYNRKIRKDLKELSDKIRNGKSGRKPKNYTDENKVDLRHLYQNKYKFRHMHIAYCLMRGRKMEEIEVPAERNKPMQSQIDRFIKQYTVEEKVEELLQEAA